MGKKIFAADIEEYEELPKARKQYLQIKRPGVGKPFVGVLLSRRFHLIPTHYWFSRTIGCTARKKPCEPCEAGRKIRVYGCAIAVERGSKRAVIIQLTEDCMKRCPWTTQMKGKLRGRLIRYERQGDKANSRTAIFIEGERVVPDEQCGPEINVVEALSDIWNAESEPPEESPLLKKLEDVLDTFGSKNRPLYENPD